MRIKKDVLYGGIGFTLFGHALLEIIESLISHDFTFLESVIGGICFLAIAVSKSEPKKI